MLRAMLAIHIPSQGATMPRSASFSPPINEAQYRRKNPRLNVAATPKVPRRAIMPSGAPINTNTMQATGIEYFLLISTRYSLMWLLLYSVSDNWLSSMLTAVLARSEEHT